jgi:hypothetical protein
VAVICHINPRINFVREGLGKGTALAVSLSANKNQGFSPEVAALSLSTRPLLSLTRSHPSRFLLCFSVLGLSS